MAHHARSWIRVFAAGAFLALLLQPSSVSLADLSCLKSALGIGLRDQKATGIEGAFSEKQWKALEKVRTIGNKEGYTPADVRAQNKILKKAGFKEPQIAELRRRALVGNWVLDSERLPPSRAGFLEGAFEPLDSKAIQKLKDKKTAYYVIDSNHEIHLLNDNPPGGKLELSDDMLWISRSENFVIHEAGTIELSSKKGAPIRFKPSYQLLASEGHEPHGAALSRTMDCLSILNQGSAGVKFFMNKLLGANVVFAGAILGSELSGAGRLKSSEGRKVVTADFIGNNLGSSASAIVAQQLLLANAGMATSVGVRTVAGLGVIALQQPIYRAMIGEGSSQKAKQIGYYDVGWLLGTTPVKLAADVFVLRKLPDILYDQCRKGGKLNVLLGPGMIRIYENGAYAYLYFTGRKMIVGQ